MNGIVQEKVKDLVALCNNRGVRRLAELSQLRGH
jgi:hypothetical protein